MTTLTEPTTFERGLALPSVPQPRLARASLVVGSYVVLAVAYFWGTLHHPAGHLVGSPGDPSLFVWYLRWVPWAIAHGHNPLFSKWLDAPAGVNLMWNTSLILPGLILAPVTALFGPVVTYNVLAAAALALSGSTTYLALRRVCALRPVASWIGGLVFAFSPFMVAQSLGHPHLTLAMFVPILAIAVHEIAIGQRWRPWQGGVLLGAVAAAQFLTGEELLAITALALALGLLALAVLHRDTVVAYRVRHFGAALPWAVVAFAVLAGGPLAFQLLGPQHVTGPLQPADLYVADLTSFVVPTRLQLLHTAGSLAVAQRWSSRGAEWSAYLGPLLVIGLAVVVWQRRRRGVVAAGVVVVALMIGALGPHVRVDGHHTSVPMPWSLAKHIPLLDSLLPVRLMVAVDLVLAGLVALAIDRLLALPRAGLRRGGTALVLLALVPLLPRMPFPSPRISTPPFFRSAAEDGIPMGSFVVIAPNPEPRNVATMRWQAVAGMRFRMAGGYALVPGPDGKPSFVGPLTPIRAVLIQLQNGVPLARMGRPVIDAVREDLLVEQATAVIVGPMAYQNRVVAFFTTVLDRLPDRVGGVYLWPLT